MKKQQLKSLQTKNDIKSAAARLFSQKGYSDTSIQDIVHLSGYSIGAFYGHFSSKKELATELWVDTMLTNIRESSQQELPFESRDSFIDHLIEHAQKVRNNALLNAISAHCSFSHEVQQTILEQAKEYFIMLVQAIRIWNPTIDEETAINCASAVQCLVSSYSQGSLIPLLQISEDGLRMLLEKLIILE